MPNRIDKNKFLQHVCVFSIYVLATIYSTWPMIKYPTRTSFQGGEEQLISYIINWNIYSILNNPLKIYDMPYFYPHNQSLAFSEPLFTPALIALPIIQIFKDPFLAFSANLLIAFTLNAFFTYLLIYKITKSLSWSFVSGLVFGFAVGRFDVAVHLQLMMMYWIPIGLISFINYLDKPNWKSAICYSMLFIAQVLSMIFLGYVYLLIGGLFYFIFTLKNSFSWRNAKTLSITMGIAFIFLALILIPYWQVSQRWGYTRTLDDAWGGSAYWLDYIYPTHSSRLEPMFHTIWHKNSWPAYWSLMGCVFTLIMIISVWKIGRNIFMNSFWLASVLGFFYSLVLSFGPWFQIIRHKRWLLLPLPYLIMFYTIPGFKSMRTPQRWSHAALFCLVIGAGISMKMLEKKFKWSAIAKKLVVFAAVVIVLWEIRWPLFSVSIASESELPLVYKWLAQQPSSIVLEIPAQDWVMPLAKVEIDRLHFHSFILNSNHRFINGYSGFSPPSWSQDIYSLQFLPDEKSFDLLKNYNVDLIIVHVNQVNDLANLWNETENALILIEKLNHSNGLSEIYNDGKSVVYAFKHNINNEFNYEKHKY